MSPKTRWYFNRFYSGLTLDNVVNLKLDMLSLDFSCFPDDYSSYPIVDDFMSIFYRIDNDTRSSLLTSRYNEYLINKKLKLLQKNCL